MQRDDGGYGDCEGPQTCNYFLDPGNPHAADYTVNVLLQLATHYDLDGLHLDYIRYPSPHFGYNPTSLKRFQAETGRGDRPVFNDEQWMQWRRDQVTKLVKRIFLNVVAERPRMMISMAGIAWGDGPRGGDFHTSAAYYVTLQDWQGWLEQGYVDSVLLMNYEGEDGAKQHEWYRHWVNWVQSQPTHRRIAGGIGGWQNDAAGNLAQLQYGDSMSGLLGAAIYSYAEPVRSERDSFIDQLRAGPWSDATAAPTVADVRAPDVGFVVGRLVIDGASQANKEVRLEAPDRPTLTMTTDGSGVFGSAKVGQGVWQLVAEGVAPQSVSVQAGSVTRVAATGVSQALVAGPAHAAFGALWERTDRPVAQGTAARSWLWGPKPWAAGSEPYVQARDGRRQVEYWDKARMEVNKPDADQHADWFVTNGLLVRELVSGRIQNGNGEAVVREPAQISVGGNANDMSHGPPYAGFGQVASLDNDHRSERATGSVVVATIDHDGKVGTADDLKRYGVANSMYSDALGHNVPDVFGRYLEKLPLPWLFVMGHPISEAYWAQYLVGDQVQDVLVQLFERRTLTFTPGNPQAYQVEMGNVGQHYYRWRYHEAPWER
ncbi:MAG: hypothetical protein NVSMB42_26110 [Herpetosiphon sp.]